MCTDDDRHTPLWWRPEDDELLESQLGLKLRRVEAPVEVLIIEPAERP